MRLGAAAVLFREKPVVLAASVPPPKENPTGADVVPLAFKEKPVAAVVVGGDVVVVAGAPPRLKPVPVTIVFGTPNVKPVVPVDGVTSLPPRVNPLVSGLVANADVGAVVVAAVVVPPKLKLRVLPAGAGVGKPVGAAVLVALGVIPVLAVVPVPKDKAGVCAVTVFVGTDVGVPKLNPVP